MADVNITSLPVATSIGATTDYLELSQATGNSVAPYISVRVTPQVLFTGTTIGNATAGLEYILSNSGAPLTSGVQPYITMPYSATITGATLVCSPSGSLTVDIWRCTYAQFDGGVTHPVVGDSICSSNKLIISSGTKTTSTLTNWTTSLTQGDIIAINISSASTAIQATLTLYLSRRL